MNTNTDLTTIQTDFAIAWNLLCTIPDDQQRTEAQNALTRAYSHVTDNIQALIAMADEFRLQRDIAINEIGFIRKNRGHISYDDVARDMSMEMDDITYDDARAIIDVLCGTSEYIINDWQKMDLREAIRMLIEDISETKQLEEEYEREIAEQAEFD